MNTIKFISNLKKKPTLKMLLSPNRIRTHSTSNFYQPILDYKLKNFLHSQRVSFQNFLKNGIIEEINAINNIKNSNIKLTFLSNHYKLIGPKVSPKKAILKRETYSCQLFIPMCGLIGYSFCYFYL